jgi:hypothetical protein
MVLCCVWLGKMVDFETLFHRGRVEGAQAQKQPSHTENESHAFPAGRGNETIRNGMVL